MRLLFLDIDGVLNDHRPWPHTKCGRILAYCIANLNDILDAVPEAQIVLSSAWRYSFSTVNSIQSLLASHGAKSIGRVHGLTELDPPQENPLPWTAREEWHRLGLLWRKAQIEKYLEEHKPCGWVAIDDLPLELENFVLTDGDIGMTSADRYKAVQILRGTP